MINLFGINSSSSWWTSLFFEPQSWGGKENGFGLAECCKDLPLSSYPSSSTTLHFEFYAEVPVGATGDGSKAAGGGALVKSSANTVTVVHVEHVEWLNKSPAQLMEELIEVSQQPSAFYFFVVSIFSNSDFVRESDR